MKYELIDETMKINGKILHRIRALKCIPLYSVIKGDLGGWIESERNLSQDNDSWVGGDAIVMDDAFISGNAYIGEDAIVCDNSEVYGNSIVIGRAKLRNRAEVKENARIYGSSILESGIVEGHATVCGTTRITGGKVLGLAFLSNGVVYPDQLVAK